MRLIDADKLERNIMSMPDDDIDEDSCNNVINVLDREPTIDAVPIEWIKNYVKRTENNGNTFAAVQYEMMLWDYLADGERS